MSTLNLRYRNDPGDPWITSSFSIQTIRLGTSSEDVTPCGCAADSPNETHYDMRIMIAPQQQPNINAIALYLLRYKMAAYQEVQHDYYVTGGFVTAALSLVEIKTANSLAEISFRLATRITDIL